MTVSLLYFLHSIVFPLFSVSFLIVKCFFLRHFFHSPSFEFVIFLLLRCLILLFLCIAFFFFFSSLLCLFSLVVILFASYIQQFFNVYNQLFRPEKSLMRRTKMNWSEEMLIKIRLWKEGQHFEAHICMSALILCWIPGMSRVTGFYFHNHYVRI